MCISFGIYVEAIVNFNVTPGDDTSTAEWCWILKKSGMNIQIHAYSTEHCPFDKFGAYVAVE